MGQTSKRAEEKRDLASLIERKKEKSEELGPVGSAMERLSAHSLKSLALEQSAALVAMENGGEDALVARAMLDASIKELWKREGLAALDWAAVLEGKVDRRVITDGLLRNALKENPSAVFPWMEEHRSEIRRVFSSSTFASLAMKAATEQGVDQVVRAYEMFPGSNLTNPLFSATYPPDFDFAALYNALIGKSDVTEAVSEWVLRDGDAAWEGVKASLQKANPFYFTDSPFNSMMMARVARDGEKAGVEWILEKTSSLSPETRTNQLVTTAQHNQLSAEGISMIVSSLAPKDRIDYASQYISKNGVTGRALAVLEMMPREDLLVFLKEKNTGVNRDKVKADLQAHYQLTEEELAGIEKKEEKP